MRAPGSPLRAAPGSGSIRASPPTGKTDADLATARYVQRRAQFLVDFVEAENSTGFHARQETARALGIAADLARQGQLSLRDASFKPTLTVMDTPAPQPPPATPTSAK